MRDDVVNEYFKWLVKIVTGDSRIKQRRYSKLLRHLHCRSFSYILEMDDNRAYDGKDLRYKFGWEFDYRKDIIKDSLDTGPCTILEMMAALSLRCEDDIMHNPDQGNRTDVWFWNMIDSLGLSYMTNVNYDKVEVNDVINTFLDRRYKPNGRGGLFTVEDSDQDMREIEIWEQLMAYLNSNIY